MILRSNFFAKELLMPAPLIKCMRSVFTNKVVAQSHLKFGALFAFVFLSLAIYWEWENSAHNSIVFYLLSAIVALITICAPYLLQPFNAIWTGFGLLLGRIVSPIILTLIYFSLIAPVGLITRLFGRDELRLKKQRVSSYWLDKEPIDPVSFKNQF